MIKDVDVIVGCQYGSEGKGLVASKVHDWRQEDGKPPYDLLVSVNSSQAGHTTHRFVDGKPQYFVTRQLPASAISNQEAAIFIGPGAIVNLDVLYKEINVLEYAGINIRNRLYISDVATVITHEDEEEERSRDMFGSIGSTMEGVGAALSKHVMRTGKIIRDYYNELSEIGVRVVNDTTFFYNNHGFKYVLLEGSQGFGLGINYKFYPKCTSRDTTTAGALAGAALPFGLVREVYGVYRTFPIRVAGNSGHLRQEMSWEELASMSGYKSLQEITTVTKRVRRVGGWDQHLANDSFFVNGVTRPILTFVNYLNSEDEGKTAYPALSYKSAEFIEKAELPWFRVSTSKEGGWVKPDFV